MSVITVNDVRQGVIAALKQNFPNLKIYGEEIKQRFQAPCFFVKIFPVSHTREQGRRFLRAHSLDIHYFPATEHANEEMHGVAEQLYDVMEYITVNEELCRGTNMSHEIVDGVLHFFVDYDFHVWREKPEKVKMQTLGQEGYVK